MLSDLMAELKLPTFPNCVTSKGTKAVLIAWDLVATLESLIQKRAALEVPPIFTTNELL